MLTMFALRINGKYVTEVCSVDVCVQLIDICNENG